MTLKQQARRLRTALALKGCPTGHGQSLELLARQHGYRDWNTLHASARRQPLPCPVTVGERVGGQYLGQEFLGRILGLQMLTSPGRFRVTIAFDESVDVVTFESFSNLRQRISCVIDRYGMTAEKTSNGQPQLRLNLQEPA